MTIVTEPKKSAKQSKTTARTPAKSKAKELEPLAAGFSPPTSLSELAEQLTATATALADAIETGEYCETLDRNLCLWIAIKGIAQREARVIGEDLKNNLVRLSDHVVAVTLSMGKKFSPDVVFPLVGINLEIAQGVVQAILNQVTRDMAYYLWQQAGSPHGEDQAFWFAAEAKIREMMSGGLA